MEKSTGPGVMSMAVTIDCPSCRGEFSVPAGDFMACPLVCTRCGYDLGLDRHERLPLWSDYVRGYAFMMATAEGDLSKLLAEAAPAPRR